MDERVYETEQERAGCQDREREELLRETRIEIEKMKEAAMEEIRSSAAAYIHVQVQQACARAEEEARYRVFMEEQSKIAVAKEQSRQFSRLGLVLFLFMAVTFAAQAAGVAISLVLSAFEVFELDLDNPIHMTLMSAIPMYLVAFPVTIALMRLIPKRGHVGGEQWSSIRLIACIIISIGLGFVGNLMGIFVNWFMPTAPEPEALDHLLTGGAMILNIGVLVFAAPVVEEVLFRKLLIDRIAGYGEGVAVVVSGLMFGLIHGNFSQFFYAFGLGMLFAYVYVKTGNIGYTIAFHMLFNLIGGVFTAQLSKGVYQIEDPVGITAIFERLFGVNLGPIMEPLCSGLLILYLVASVVCAISGAVILIVNRREITFRPGDKPIGWGRRFSTVTLNLGMIIYLAMCAGQFWLQTRG